MPAIQGSLVVERFLEAIGPVASIAIGGEDKKVHLQRAKLSDDQQTIQLVDGEKELAVCFESSVMKL